MKALRCATLLILLALALSLAATANAEVVGPSTPVSQAASVFRGTTIDVHCEQTAQEWSDLLGPFGIAYLAFVPYSDLSSLYLGPTVCNEMLAAASDPTHPVVSLNRAIALQTFLHEMMHTAGIRDEKQAEEMSMFLYRWYLVKFWSYPFAQTAQMYRYAWVRHLERGVNYVIPKKYDPEMWLSGPYRGPTLTPAP